MIAAGCHSLYDMEILSVMGLVEVLSHLPAILKVKNGLIKHFEQYPPDIFIGVDAPDFNLRVEKALKKKGIKTVHYVSPTVWAWRENRIHGIKKAADCVLGLFPFEQDVYDKHNVAYRFVGHTLADAIPMVPDQHAARQALDINAQDTLLAVLPGSRNGEVSVLLPIFVDTIRHILSSKPACRFIIPAANTHRYDYIEQYLREYAEDLLNNKQIILTQGNARQAMIASDAILLASGTATLEAMLCKRPMVAAYKISGMTYRIMQRLYKAPFFTLPNLLARRQIIPELLQDEVNPVTLSEHLLSFLEQDNSALIDTFCELHETLRQGADQQSARAVLDLINA